MKRARRIVAALNACWTDLVGDAAARAYQAIRKLVASPGEGVAYLGKRLSPVLAPDAKRQAKLIADLDSDIFATRDAAMKESTKLGELATSALRAARNQSPSAEARRRIEQLLAKLENIVATGERLRQARAVEVLEGIGASGVRRLLGRFADGAAGAWLTREAKAALDRVSRWPAVP